eukprot:m.92633 g.92633  ORF g.92633 m.92633 type:complete len:261 (+) comp12989_c0_seq2:244-1026(+)
MKETQIPDTLVRRGTHEQTQYDARSRTIVQRATASKETRLGGVSMIYQDPEVVHCNRGLIMIAWLVLILISIALIVLGLLQQSIVAATEVAQATRSMTITTYASVTIGLFRSCITNAAETECVVWEFASNLWKTGACLQIVGLFLATTTVILLIISWRAMHLLLWAKVVNTITCISWVLSVFFIGLGLRDLSRPCAPDGSGHACGFRCNAQDELPSYFTICRPFYFGNSMWFYISGSFALLIGSLLAACIRVRVFYDRNT